MTDKNNDSLNDDETQEVLHTTIDLLKSLRNLIVWSGKAEDKALNPNGDVSSDEIATTMEALVNEFQWQGKRAIKAYKKLRSQGVDFGDEMNEIIDRIEEPNDNNPT